MSGVEERLQYLEETKTKLKDSINAMGGNLEDSTPFDEYPAQLPDLIEKNIIPQGTLDELTISLVDINGEEV